jgi:hypothetical protein
MKPIYYDLTKLNEFFGIASSEPMEILSEKELQEQGLIEPIEGGWSGPDHPSYVHGQTGTPEYKRQRYHVWKHDPEFVKRKSEHSRKSYEKHKEKIQAKKKEYYQKNREKIIQQQIQYKLDNVDKKKEYDRQRFQRRAHPCLCIFTGMVY